MIFVYEYTMRRYAVMPFVYECIGDMNGLSADIQRIFVWYKQREI